MIQNTYFELVFFLYKTTGFLTGLEREIFK